MYGWKYIVGICILLIDYVWNSTKWWEIKIHFNIFLLSKGFDKLTLCLALLL